LGQIESMAQLVERTATIQLLRDKMYQTCLAYANGAISGTTYSVIMAQLDRTIVTLLMSENAAAAFGRSGAVIGTQTSASGSSSMTGPGSEQALDKSVKAVGDAQSALLKAQEGLAAVTKEKGEACGLEKASETGPGDACKAIAAEESKVAEAENHLNATLRVLQTTTVVQSNARAETSKASGIGGLDRSPTADLARELRLMQDNFLQQDPNDLFLPTCMVELGLHSQQSSTAGQVLDRLLANIQVSREALGRAEGDESAAAQARSSSNSKDAGANWNAANARLTKAREKSTSADADLASFLRDPQGLITALRDSGAGDPYSLIFGEVLDRWRAQNTALSSEESQEEVSLVAGAASLSRQSQLAETCRAELPAYLVYTRKFSETYRMARLNAMVQIEAASAGSRDVIERTRLLEQFQGALKACKEGDEKQKANCQEAVQKVFSPAALSAVN